MGEVPAGRRGTLSKRFVLSPSGPTGPPPPCDGGGVRKVSPALRGRQSWADALPAILGRRRLGLPPALLLGFEERGEDLADGAFGDVAGDEDHTAAAVLVGPGFERRRRMEDMLHAVDHHRLVGV